MALPKLARLEEIFSGGSATTTRRWSATSFFDRVIFVNPTVSPVAFRAGDSACRAVPGLPSQETYDGVTSFYGHVILWRGDVIKWSDLDDFSMWIPVGQTAGSFVLTLSHPFTQVEVGVSSGWVYVNEDITGMTVGQFIRTTYDPLYDYYSVSEVAPVGSVSGQAINTNQSVSGTQNLYTTEYQSWLLNSHIGFEVDRVPLRVTGSSINENFSSTTAGTFTVPATNSSVVVALTAVPAFTIGQYVSLNTAAAQVGSDIYQVLSKDTNSSSPTITLQRTGIGSQVQAVGATYASGSSLISQPFVTVTPVNASDAPVFVARMGKILPLYGFKITSQDLTGRSPTGTVFPVGRQIFSIDANEAGETINAGASINGPIWNWVSLSNIGFVLKERSVQSVQFVGLDAGTFLFKTEITDEGLFGRYTFKKLGEDRLCFLGQRELYMSSGAQAPVPIARQFTRQLFSEIDRARADEIVFGHNEGANEIWIVYFVNGGSQKIFIFNYVENSCTIDAWTSTVGPITAMASILWRADVPWLAMTDPWNATPGVWLDYEGTGDKTRFLMVATEGKNYLPARPYLAEQGTAYLHDGAAYTASCETVDFDWGNDTAFKYSDTLMMSLQIKQKLSPRPFKLFVQIGARDSLDADVRWTDPTWIEVSGNGNYAPNISLRKGGRFHRIRFYSTDPNTQWRISNFKLVGRKGSTY